MGGEDCSSFIRLTRVVELTQPLPLVLEGLRRVFLVVVVERAQLVVAQRLHDGLQNHPSIDPPEAGVRPAW